MHKAIYIILVLGFSVIAAPTEKAFYFELLGQGGALGINCERKYDNIVFHYGVSTALLAYGLPVGFNYSFGDKNRLSFGLSITPGFLYFHYLSSTFWPKFVAVSGNASYRYYIIESTFVQFSYNPTYLKLFDDIKNPI